MCILLIHTSEKHTHTFNGPLSATTQVSQYQKGKTNLDFTEARDSELQWYQLGHMQICTSLQTDNHASTQPLCFLQAGCPSCRPTNSDKALKGYTSEKPGALCLPLEYRLPVSLEQWRRRAVNTGTSLQMQGRPAWSVVIQCTACEYRMITADSPN